TKGDLKAVDEAARDLVRARVDPPLHRWDLGQSRGEAGNGEYPHRVLCRNRSGRHRTCREPRQTWRETHGCPLSLNRSDGEAPGSSEGTPAESSAIRDVL